jgi:hypothetical protein
MTARLNVSDIWRIFVVARLARGGSGKAGSLLGEEVGEGASDELTTLDG